MILLSYLLYFAALVGLGGLVAVWMDRVYSGNLPAALLRAEGALLRLGGVVPDRGMGWGAMRWPCWRSTRSGLCFCTRCCARRALGR